MRKAFIACFYDNDTKFHRYKINCEKCREKNEIAKISEIERSEEEEGWKGGTLNILHSMPPSLSGFCATRRKKKRKKERGKKEKEKKAVARATVYNKHRGRKKVV